MPRRAKFNVLKSPCPIGRPPWTSQDEQRGPCSAATSSICPSFAYRLVCETKHRARGVDGVVVPLVRMGDVNNAGMAAMASPFMGRYKAIEAL
jgi:hypothetical protein